MAKSAVTFTFTFPVVLNYVHLITPQPYMENGVAKGDPMYSAVLVFNPDHTDLPGLKAAMVETAKQEWPARNIGEAVKEKTLQMPLKTGEGEINRRTAIFKKSGLEYDGKLDSLKGKMLLKASSKFPPDLSYIEGGKIIDLLDERQIKAAERRFFSGAEALVCLNFKAFNAKNSSQTDGIKVFLQSVVVTGKGERIGGSTPGSQRFKDYLGRISQDDPTAGLDDEFPF